MNKKNISILLVSFLLIFLLSLPLTTSAQDENDLPVKVPEKEPFHRSLNELTWEQLHNVVAPDPNPDDAGLQLDLKNDSLSGTVYAGPYPFEAGTEPGCSYYPYAHYDHGEPLENGVGEIHIENVLEEGNDENTNDWPEGQYGDPQNAPTMTMAYRVSLSPHGDFYDARRSFFCDGPCGDPANWEPQLTIVEGPFVNKLTSNEEITPSIALETDVPSTCTVSIPGAGEFVSGSSKRHEIDITGLKPDTKYNYNVTCEAEGQTVSSGQYHFRTAPKPGSDKTFKFAFVSDAREGGEGGEAELMGHNAKTLKRIATDAYRRGADLLVFGGDLVNGYTTSKEDFVLQLKGWKKSMGGFWRSHSVFAAMGNHECLLSAYGPADSIWGSLKLDQWPYETDSAEAVFAQELYNPENGPTPSDERRPTYKENIHKFQYGSSLFIAFNNNYWYTSNEKVPQYGGSPEGYIMPDQLDWIEKTLEEAEQDPTVESIFLYAQEPVFPTGGHPEDAMWYHGNNNVRAYEKNSSGEVVEAGPGIIEVRNRFVEAMGSSSKVVTKLVGDEHLYSRTKFDDTTPVGVYPEDDRDGDGVLEKPYSPNKNIEYPFWNITAGNAGAPWYSDEQVPWEPEIIDSRLGYLMFEVSGDDVSLTSIALRGDEIVEQVDDLMAIKEE